MNEAEDRNDEGSSWLCRAVQKAVTGRKLICEGQQKKLFLTNSNGSAV